VRNTPSAPPARMPRSRRHAVALSVALAVAALAGPAAAGPADIPYPSLLVTNAEIAGLRVRASQAPYDEIRRQAVGIADTLSLSASPTTAANIKERALR